MLLHSLSEYTGPKARKGLHNIRLFVAPLAQDIGGQEAINKVHRVKSLCGWIRYARARTKAAFEERGARGGGSLPGKVAWRLLLLRSLRDGWVLLGRCVNLLVRTLPLTLSISIAGFLRLRRLPSWWLILGFLTPVRLKFPDWLWLVFKSALGLNELHLLLELLGDLTLEAKERCAEVVENFWSTITIPGGVVGGVHWVHDYKHVLVYLRQRIEWPKTNSYNKSPLFLISRQSPF